MQTCTYESFHSRLTFAGCTADSRHCCWPAFIPGQAARFPSSLSCCVILSSLSCCVILTHCVIKYCDAGSCVVPTLVANKPYIYCCFHSIVEQYTAGPGLDLHSCKIHHSILYGGRPVQYTVPGVLRVSLQLTVSARSSSR